MTSGYEHLTVMTQDEVAEALGTTRQRVSWLERHAMQKLRLCKGLTLQALLRAMAEQEPVQVGGRMTRRST